MRSNNWWRSWWLSDSQRKVWKHIQTIVNRDQTFSSFSWVVIINLTSPWVFLPSLPPFVWVGASGCSSGHQSQSTTPWTSPGPQYSPFASPKSLHSACTHHLHPVSLVKGGSDGESVEYFYLQENINRVLIYKTWAWLWDWKLTFKIDILTWSFCLQLMLSLIINAVFLFSCS